MVIKEVSYRNFRNLDDTKIEFAPGTNVLWGNNAQGKTNILEGIYLFARGKSFRATAERELVRFGNTDATADIVFRREGDSSDISLGAYIPSAGRKKFSRNGVMLSGVSEMIGELCAVLFCPDHLSLVSGSPGERRSFLDIAIAQLSPIYIANLRKYNRALEQRNALIKAAAERKVSEYEWEAYAEIMASCAAYISSARLLYIGLLADYVEHIFADMTGEKETTDILYHTRMIPSDRSSDVPTVNNPSDGEFPDEAHEVSPNRNKVLLPTDAEADSNAVCHIKKLLTENTEREIRAGTTLYGIHKDDITIKLNSLDARTYASQGQKRSLSLAMKLAEGEIAKKVFGEYPVFLLDDVLSELDSGRREFILRELDGRQIIVTSCEPEIYESHGECKFIEVESGSIREYR